MNALFLLSTFLIGFFLELVFSHYLSLFSVAPNILLLLTIAMGFMLGPTLGETFGFCWGLLADVMGVQLFGLNSLLLTLFGYVAGKLRRRFDSERPTPQVVIACVTTVLNAVLSMMIYGMTEESEHRMGVVALMIAVVMNGLLAGGVFWTVDRWIDLWQIDRERV